MSKNVVIVESPAKAKTIGRFLGRDYIVKASMGHVRDLPEGTLGVSVEQAFEPKYVVPKDKKALVKELDKAVKEASEIFLATDPDREGEAISWHVREVLNDRKALEGVDVKRVVFHEVTKGAVLDALVKAGANDINGPSFSVSDDTGPKAEARKRALERARSMALDYARVAGYSNVRVLQISESVQGSAREYSADAIRVTGSRIGGAPPVQAGMVETGVTVSVTYEAVN